MCWSYMGTLVLELHGNTCVGATWEHLCWSYMGTRVLELHGHTCVEAT